MGAFISYYTLKKARLLIIVCTVHNPRFASEKESGAQN